MVSTVLSFPSFLTTSFVPKPSPKSNNLKLFPIAKASNADEIDMVQSANGIWSAKTNEKVVVLWDLDNKPPRGPPYDAGMALRNLASLFGTVIDVAAYANRHAFSHVPRRIIHQRRERREMDILERRGVNIPEQPYVCGVCGRKCKTNLDLKKHFIQLHERERNKKLARMRMLKGKKRKKYKERFVSGNTKYEDTARDLITPKTGYGLAKELRRAGIYVRTVEDKPQAADAALKRQMLHSMGNGVDWLFLVSDDSDFTEMMWKARESSVRTVVVGDWRNSLGRQADLWVPWNGVEAGDVAEEINKSGRSFRTDGSGSIDDLFSIAEDDDERSNSSVDSVVDRILGRDNGKSSGRLRISQFSEEESIGGGPGGSLDDDDLRLYGSSLPGDDLFWESETDEDEDWESDA